MTIPNVTVQARVSPELKEEAEAVFAAIGLSTADAIRIFLQQAVNSGGLPFQPTAKRPTPTSSPSNQFTNTLSGNLLKQKVETEHMSFEAEEYRLRVGNLISAQRPGKQKSRLYSVEAIKVEIREMWRENKTREWVESRDTHSIDIQAFTHIKIVSEQAPKAGDKAD